MVISPFAPLSSLSSNELVVGIFVNEEDDERQSFEHSPTGIPKQSQRASNGAQKAFEIDSYVEFRVVKTNSKGKKQLRVLGIDKHNLYNKPIAEAQDGSRVKFTSNLISSFLNKDTVSRASRPISSISCCSVDAIRSSCFNIQFRDNMKLVIRQYEAESNDDATRIVDLIQYHMENSYRNAR